MKSTKKYLVISVILLAIGFLGLLISSTIGYMFVPGDMMMSGQSTISEENDNHTAQEEAEGEEIWNKLQSKEVECKDLTDDDFGALGEYFMGQMTGASHEAMNTMMEQMMGKEGEEQMHIALGKQMSGCEPNAPMSQNMMNNMMMDMMGSSSPNNE